MEIKDKELLTSELEEFMLAAEVEQLKVKLADDMDGEKLLVKNKSDADFYLKQIAKLRQQKEEINDFVDAEIEREVKNYEAYREQSLRPLDGQIAFYEEALRTFALNEFEETGKKTIKLPNGSVTIRKQPPKFVYDDEQIIDFLQENNMDTYTKTKVEVNKKELKKYGAVNNDNQLIVDGKVVPGVIVIPQEDKVEVK